MMHKHTLKEWIQLSKPKEEIIYQASTVDGRDGLTNSSIGMCWPYIFEYENIEKTQLGNHCELLECAISDWTDETRRGGSAINRKAILKTLEKNGIINKATNHTVHYHKLPNYKFTISPEGNAVDCHRHYEALMAGCIPIVEVNPIIQEKYGNVPFLYTTDYSEITESYLLDQYDIMLNKTWDFTKLYLSSWPEEDQTRIKIQGNFWGMRCANKLCYL